MEWVRFYILHLKPKQGAWGLEALWTGPVGSRGAWEDTMTTYNVSWIGFCYHQALCLHETAGSFFSAREATKPQKEDWTPGLSHVKHHCGLVFPNASSICSFPHSSLQWEKMVGQGLGREVHRDAKARCWPPDLTEVEASSTIFKRRSKTDMMLKT